MYNIPAISVTELEKKAHEARKRYLTVASKCRALHIGSSLSQLDILTVLYGAFLQVSPKTADSPDRDRFILSKGHAALGFYVVLEQHGFISSVEVESYGQDGTKLAAHPVLGSAPGIEATSGSLGHGLPMTVGMAIAGKKEDRNSKMVVLLSDGECDEGSNWEAILLAGHLHLDNVLVIIDYNKIQSFGRTEDVLDLEPFAKKWEAMRFNVVEVDGHSCKDLCAVFSSIKDNGKPTVIIAHTIKGKGVSYMENTIEWHYLNLSPEALPGALKELDQ